MNWSRVLLPLLLKSLVNLILNGDLTLSGLDDYYGRFLIDDKGLNKRNITRDELVNFSDVFDVRS